MPARPDLPVRPSQTVLGQALVFQAPAIPAPGFAEAAIAEIIGKCDTSDVPLPKTEITKAVLDPTGLWGNEDFEARLLCTDPDAAGGSTDVSDISWVVPTVGLGTATFVPGMPGQSDINVFNGSESAWRTWLRQNTR